MIPIQIAVRGFAIGIFKPRAFEISDPSLYRWTSLRVSAIGALCASPESS